MGALDKEYYLEVVCEDCDIDVRIFHRTFPQLPLFYHTVLEVQADLDLYIYLEVFNAISHKWSLKL